MTHRRKVVWCVAIGIFLLGLLLAYFAPNLIVYELKEGHGSAYYLGVPFFHSGQDCPCCGGLKYASPWSLVLSILFFTIISCLFLCIYSAKCGINKTSRFIIALTGLVIVYFALNELNDRLPMTTEVTFTC